MNDNFQNENEIVETFGFTDKLVGVFTSPSETFTTLRMQEKSTTTWLIPVILLILIISSVNLVTMSNPTVNMKIQEKQLLQIEKNFSEMVESGEMTQEQANQQLNEIEGRISEQMEKGKWIQIPSVVLIVFVFFFIISGFFFLVVKFGLNGNGNYTQAMVAYGFPYYILAIQTLIMGLVIILLEEPMQSLSIGEFIQADKETIVGLLLSKLDLFSIWYYYAISIGFAKMFKIESVSKVIITVFSIWIGFSFLFFFLAKAFPTLKFFGF